MGQRSSFPSLVARSIVPLHFEGWKHFREPRDTAIGKFDGSPFGDRIHWLARGATIEIDV
jgi:hypothetical protein